MRQVYLAATGRNYGKTTFALGLLAALIDRGYATAFTKPVGQRYALVDEIPADEDAILMRNLFELDDPIEDMSPVHIRRGFTKSFIRGEVVEDPATKIDAAHRRLVADHDALLIEGTGHAGVGAVVGLSNADVAARLRAPVVIISEGGIGRPIDQIVLNQALFAHRGVPIVGAVINKVDVEADPSLPEVLEQGLARHGIDLLGVLPYRPMLAHPTLTMLIEQMHGELLSSGEDMDRLIEHVAIGSGQARHVLEKIGPGSLLIVQGDRQDIIHAVIAANETQKQLNVEPGLMERLRNRARFGRVPDDPEARLLAGIVFSGGRWPADRDIVALRDAGVFAFLVEDETYPVASQIHGLLVKTHVQDRSKIEVIKQTFAEHFDVDALLERLEQPGAPDGTPTGSAEDAPGSTAGPTPRWVWLRCRDARALLLHPHEHVVDEPGRPQHDRHRQQCRPIDPLQLAQGHGVGTGGVLDLGQRLGREDLLHQPAQDVAFAFTRHVGLARCGQRSIQHRGGRPLPRCQVHVARRQRQPVGFAHGGTGDDPRGQRQVGGHARDDHDLLGILLAEVGVLRTDQREQRGHDGGHSVEVAGPGRALQGLGDSTDADGGVEARRVDLFDSGDPDDVEGLRFADGDVRLGGARIARVVRGVVELARVHEDGGHRGGVLRAGAPHQRPVPFVEPAHRGHQPDRPCAPWPWPRATRRGCAGRGSWPLGRSVHRPVPSDQRSRSRGKVRGDSAWSSLPRPSTSLSTPSSMEVNSASAGKSPVTTASW